MTVSRSSIAACFRAGKFSDAYAKRGAAILMAVSLVWAAGCREAGGLTSFVGETVSPPREFTVEEIREVRKPYTSLAPVYEERIQAYGTPMRHEPTVVELAATSLARIGPAAVDPLIETMSDTDPRIRVQAIQALGRMGPPAAPAVPHLIAALNDPDVYVRRNAAHTLGEIGPEAAEAVPALIEAMRDDEDGPSPTADDKPEL